MNHANQFAWMPGHLLTDGYQPKFTEPESLVDQLNATCGMRRREILRMAQVAWGVDLAIHRMMVARVTR